MSKAKYAICGEHASHLARVRRTIRREMGRSMTPEQAESLTIKRMIFHEVGGKQETLLDAVVDTPDHALFFLERVKSVLRESRYIFNADSTVPLALRRAAKSDAGFVGERRKLASAFHQSHKEAPNSKPGTFFMFALTSSAGLVQALLKFDRPESVAYTISVARDGKKTAQFTANPPINEAKTGLQKAALLTETDATFEALVTDRAGRYAVSQYFERFLGAHRYAEPAELTVTLGHHVPRKTPCRIYVGKTHVRVTYATRDGKRYATNIIALDPE